MPNTLHSRCVRHTLIIAAFLIGIPTVAHAQAPRATVALVRELPDSTANATVIRTATHTFVLLRERDADAATLATAMSTVYRSQTRAVDGPNAKLVINLHGQRSLASLRPNERQLADQYLARLRNAKPDNLDGVGRARATTITFEPAGQATAR